MLFDHVVVVVDDVVVVVIVNDVVLVGCYCFLFFCSFAVHLRLVTVTFSDLGMQIFGLFIQLEMLRFYLEFLGRSF